MSINPEFSQKIFAGTKRFEYRTRLCKDNVDTIIIYETSPTKMIVGEVSVIKKLSAEKDKLWQETNSYSGINESFFYDYFRKQNIANAYALSKATKYKHPVPLEVANIKAAPQSFIYIKDEHLLSKIRQAGN